MHQEYPGRHQDPKDRAASVCSNLGKIKGPMFSHSFNSHHSYRPASIFLGRLPYWTRETTYLMPLWFRKGMYGLVFSYSYLPPAFLVLSHGFIVNAGALSRGILNYLWTTSTPPSSAMPSNSCLHCVETSGLSSPPQLPC